MRLETPQPHTHFAGSDTSSMPPVNPEVVRTAAVAAAAAMSGGLAVLAFNRLTVTQYTPPKVWEPKELGGAMGAMNKPTAGSRFKKTLSKGKHPYQLYSLGTPNGQKVTILLEELLMEKGTEYDAWFVDIFQLEQFGDEFVDINPNSKIPALLDQSVNPPQRIFESGNMLLYLAEKEGSSLLPREHDKRTECLNWLFWQMGSAPYVGGGFGHFYKYAPIKIEYCVDRFSMETKRQLDVLDKRLEESAWLAGPQYSIADIAVYPWISCIDKFYSATEFLQLNEYKNLQRWVGQMEARPAVQRGMRVNSFGPTAIRERHSEADFNLNPIEK